MNKGPGGYEASEAFFFPIIALLLVVGLWFLLKTPLLYICFYSSYYMFGFYQHLTWLMTQSEINTLINAKAAIPSVKPPEQGLSALIMLMEIHGYILRWLAVPFMLWVGFRSKRHVVRFKYRRDIKSVYDLIDIQAKHFPASAIIKGKNLLATHPYKGPWATYTLPLDFALDNQLLWTSTKRVTGADTLDENKMAPIPAFLPDEKLQHFREKRLMLPSWRYVLLSLKRANALFIQQTGELWSGSGKLPPLEKALYAAFCAQGCGEQGEAWKMIEQLGFSFREGKRDAKGKLVTPHYANTTGTDEMLKKYGNRKDILSITYLHAHKNNVLTATLALARKKGRLMHANFLWLKPVNRTLWYALCGQGGQVPYWEAAGPWAHAQVEVKMGRKIPKPMVAGAVHALKTTMSKEHWIDPGEYSEEFQKQQVVAANELLTKESERANRRTRTGTHQGGQQSMLGNTFATPQRRKNGATEDDEP